ncbi:low temperature requirement protein A [Monashia sp. NPDC004114]
MSPVNIVPLHVRMTPRDPHEPHRVATPLELFFDLVFVVAVSSAAAQWHHGISDGDLSKLLSFVIVFVAIWWAWMNYTWFASAYATDDVVFRLMTFVIMVGSLMLAAGVPEMFGARNSKLLVAGYVVMRLAMVVLWLRAAASHPEGRRTALTYAVGIAIVQVYWVLRLFTSGDTSLVVTWFVGMALEMSVPIIAERRGVTPFHPHHIAERYSLFTIIVLGEVILSTMQAVQGALNHTTFELVELIAGGLLIVFSMWWLYFKRDQVELFAGEFWTVFTCSYGHLFIFASVAASGAALAAGVDVVQHHAHASVRFVALALAVPLAIYVVALAGMHALGERRAVVARPGVVVAVVLLVVGLWAPSMGASVLLMGVVLALAVAEHVWFGARSVRAIAAPQDRAG